MYVCVYVMYGGGPRIDEVACDDGSAPGRHATGDVIPINIELMRYGHCFLICFFNNWWTGTKRDMGRAKTCPIKAELHAHATGTGGMAASTKLQTWLRTWTDDEIPEKVDSITAACWLASYAASLRDAKQHGVGGSRNQNGRNHGFAIGRSLFKQRIVSPGIRDADGELRADPDDIDRILLDSRRHIWTLDPDQRSAGTAILKRYFDRGKKIDFPDAPTPRLQDIVGQILHCSNSAPGLDNIPYEVLHAGPMFVAHLIGQGFYATEIGDYMVIRVLGPATDLLVWIPKKDGAETAAGQRPLQLPSTLRRMFGSCLMDIVGPLVEPHLTEDQSAVKGGSCAKNIKLAYQHLMLDPALGPETSYGQAWDDFLLDAASPCAKVCASIDCAKLAKRPACLLANQNKAFERLSIGWLIRVCKAWGMPAWMLLALLCLTAGRSVQAHVTGKLGKRMMLRCGTGMGGPASMFLWNVAYDPVMYGIGQAVRTRCPTFVDDLNALVTGPGHALATMLMIVVCGHAAGLVTDIHTCTSLGSPTGLAAARRILVAFPVTIRHEREEGPDAMTILGLPAELIQAILAVDLGSEWANACTVFVRPCFCTIKTVIIPESGVREWAQALRLCPFGQKAVRARHAYLGFSLGSASTILRDCYGPWEPKCVAAIQQDTWAAATKRFKQRAAAVTGSLSPGLRALQLNIFMDSSIVYPSTLCPPTPKQMQGIIKAARDLIPTGRWAPWYIATALWPTFGIRGAPRHPSISQQTAHLRTWLRGDFAAPDGFPDRAQSAMNACITWAALPSGGRRQGSKRPGLFQTRVKTLVDAIRGHVPMPSNSSGGTGIYLALWHQAFGSKVREWLDKRSKCSQRRWWTTTGDEWEVITAAPSYNAAFHSLRLFAGGVSGKQGGRGKDVRTTFLRQCSQCKLKPAIIAWTTPCQEQTGMGWCHECLPAGARNGHGWTDVIKFQHNPESGPPNTFHAAERNEPNYNADWAEVDSCFGCCPLCGFGEHSSEHLLIWCPAVAHAWASTITDYPCPGQYRKDCKKRPDAYSIMCTFFHQVSFLSISLYGKHTLQWLEAANQIIRRVRNARLATYMQKQTTILADDFEQWNVDDEHEALLASPLPQAWKTLGKECEVCNCDPSCTKANVAGRIGRNKHHRQCTTIIRLVPTARKPIAQGSLIAKLYGNTHRAHWPFGGKGWWPRPIEAPKPESNCEWRSKQCRHCMQYTASLYATKKIKAEYGLTAAPPHALFLGSGIYPHFEAFYDGSICEKDGRSAGGASAVLYGPPDDDGRRPLLCKQGITLPSVTRIVVAEAHGASLCAELLREHLCLQLHNSAQQAACIGGDNPSITGICGGSRGTRQPDVRIALGAATQLACMHDHDISWIHIPRSLNGEAHTFALNAARLAVQEACRGIFVSHTI